MEQKRYYCDWAFSKPDGKVDTLWNKIVFISLIVVTVVSSIIYYNIIMHDHGDDLETYYESSYKYLDEIADTVISKDGINISAIPEDVVEYEITYKDGKIIFKYGLDNNEGKILATSASTTITLSKDFEIINKEPNFSSKEEYVKSHKTSIYVLIPILGAFTWCVLAFIGGIVMLVAIPISILHKKINIKKNIS